METQMQKKFETEKGEPCLLVDGYKFSESKVLKKCGNIRYRCTNKNFSASLLVDKDAICEFSFKKKHENNLLTRPNNLIRQELRNTEKDIQPIYSDIKLWRKCMYDKRRKNILKVAKSLDESITQLFDSRENITTNSGELFCHMEEISSEVVFTCQTNLD
ncbi:hypothetical protein QTP88_005947 [Uroleucon formosanum]